MREASQAPSTPRSPSGPGRVARWLTVLLVVALFGGAVASYRFEVGARHLPWLVADPLEEPAAVAAPAGLDLPEWSPPDLPVTSPAPGEVAPQQVARALRKPLADPDLGGRVSVAVRSLDGSGDTWATGTGRFIPASTTKVVTAAAVLDALGPDHRFVTRVVRSGPREIVLVGGGDPYLASVGLLPDEETSTYPMRADLATLAADVAAALDGTKRVRVRYDDSLFSGPTASPKWRADYIPDDIVSPITALMADGGRQPDDWRRYDDPSLAAAQAFVAALRDAGIAVAGAPGPATAPAAAEEIASVEGAPLHQVVTRMLEVSDNEAAEVLAHHVGLARTGEGSFAGGAAGSLQVLDAWGIDTTGVELYDGSGLSRHNRLTSTALLGLISHAAGPEGAQVRTVLTGMPVAGFSGSLTWRFEDEADLALGTVRAKTGTLTGVQALAGVVTGRDGLPMAFVVAADRAPEARKLDAQLALDHVAAALATCRCSRPPG